MPERRQTVFLELIQSSSNSSFVIRSPRPVEIAASRADADGGGDPVSKNQQVADRL